MQCCPAYFILIYLEIKIKNNFFRIIKKLMTLLMIFGYIFINLIYNSCQFFKINFKTTFHALLLCILYVRLTVGNQENKKLGNQETRKLRNQNTRKLGNQETRKLGNQKTRKPGNQETRKLGNQETRKPELKTLEWWISRALLDLLFLLISRLNNKYGLFSSCY